MKNFLLVFFGVIGQIIFDSLISLLIVYYPLQFIIHEFQLESINIFTLFNIIFILKIILNNLVGNTYLAILINQIKKTQTYE